MPFSLSPKDSSFYPLFTASAENLVAATDVHAGFRWRVRLGGNAGTLFWIDPKEDLIAIYLVQVSDYERVKLRNQFRAMVQSAIIE